jgi:hypothetical protein
MMYREMDMRFWLRQAEAETRGRTAIREDIGTLLAQAGARVRMQSIAQTLHPWLATPAFNRVLGTITKRLSASPRKISGQLAWLLVDILPRVLRQR